MTQPLHPHLYFSSGELVALREQAKQGVRAEVLARIVHWCERLLDPNDPDHFDCDTFAKPHWRERSGIMQFRSSMLLLSFGYAFTGDERFGIAARDGTINAIKLKLADGEAICYGSAYPGWRRSVAHDKASYAWAMSTAYDLCHDLFDAEQRQLFIEHALESIELVRNDLAIRYGDDNQMINNRGARGQIGAYGYYPLLLEGEVEMPHLEADIGQAMAAAEAYLHVSFDQDGVCFDGPAYGGVLEIIYYFCLMLARSGRPNLLRGGRWEKYLHHLVYELLPGGYSLNNLNDCHTPCGAVTPVLFLMGTPQGAVIPWLARQLDLHPHRLERTNHSLADAFMGSTSFLFLLNWRDDVPIKSPQELGYPLSRQFPDRGIASMRTGWADDDYLLSHRCGREMWRLHKQSDQNHLALYALGEHFLVDEGYGQPELSRMADLRQNVNRYFNRADVHNVVLFDGRDQNGNPSTPGWAEGRLIDWESNAQFDTSLGDCREAYGFDHAIDEALRRVVFVRDTPHPFVVVIDTMCVDSGAAQRCYEAFWRSAHDNEFEIDGNSFRILGRTNDCHGQVLFPTAVEVSTRLHCNLPQLIVKAHAIRLEMVTVFTPLRRGEPPLRFTCTRNDEGLFRIEAYDGDIRHTLHTGTITTGPLGDPMKVRCEKLI